ncbi:hypothetical protein [Microcoleus sp.]|uniref:hypothetical protein n=1 Tax=Microcoleus sp. TaxID=44472 RepID=UPI0035940B17
MSRLMPQPAMKLRRYLLSLKGRSLVSFTLSLITSISAITPTLAAPTRHRDNQLIGSEKGLLAWHKAHFTDIIDLSVKFPLRELPHWIDLHCIHSQNILKLSALHLC